MFIQILLLINLILNFSVFAKENNTQPETKITSESKSESLVSLAPMYEIRKDAFRIGYLQFLNQNLSEKNLTLDSLKSIFETTSIEETSNTDITSYNGVKYYFGKNGVPQIMILFWGTDLKDQVKRSIKLADALGSELIYRGHFISEYWTPKTTTQDLSNNSDLPLNLSLQGKSLTFKNIKESWTLLATTKNLDVLYRGQPGEIIYQPFKTVSQVLESKEPHWNFVKNNIMASLPVVPKTTETMEGLFQKSDADCVFEDAIKNLVYCASTPRAHEASVELRKFMGIHPERSKMLFDFNSGFAEIKLPAHKSESTFDRLLELTEPRFAYSGDSKKITQKIQDQSLKKSASGKESLTVLKDFRVDFFNSSNEKISWVQFWGVNEVERSQIVQHLLETLTPDHYKYLDIEKPIANSREVASNEQSEKLVGIYYEKDKDWFDRNKLRYYNKDYISTKFGMSRYDYTTEAGSGLSHLNRASTSVTSFVDLGGTWWATRSFWGIQAQGRYAGLSHNINTDSKSGHVYKVEMGPKFRYFLNQSPFSTGFEMFVGFQRDADFVNSNSILGSLTMNHLPVEVKAFTFFGTQWRPGLILRRSLILGGTQEFSGAVASSVSGSANFLESEVLYYQKDSSFDLRLAAQYQKTDFKINNISSERQELGITFGIVRSWN